MSHESYQDDYKMLHPGLPSYKNLLFIYLFISRTHGKQHRVREGVRIRNA